MQFLTYQFSVIGLNPDFSEQLCILSLPTENSLQNLEFESFLLSLVTAQVPFW